MKKLILSLIIVTIFTTCRKSAFIDDHFIFGQYYNYCNSNCVNYFMIKKDRLYIDDMTHPSKRLKFKNQTLTQDKFNLAKQLVDILPENLKNSPSQSFGCPDCGDEGAYYIEIKKNRTSKKFHIEMDTAKLPKELKNYIPEMEKVISQLLK